MRKTIGLFCAMAVVLAWAGRAAAHCDTLDGPVIQDARRALNDGDVTPVLKWIRAGDEAEMRRVFDLTLSVRATNAKARELADTYFFETLVRLHRAGEGAPFTGLKAAGRDFGPAVSGADKALETGEIDAVAELIAHEAKHGIVERFKRARAAREHAGDSVSAGRDYVAAYVDFVHYAEALYETAHRKAGGHGEAEHGHR
ncbi:MAG: DUF6448 family protein [Deltaproteobacteria bacterium]|nr:DUF6448 family protein [Deltaproteobacteria bacterium]